MSRSPNSAPRPATNDSILGIRETVDQISSQGPVFKAALGLAAVAGAALAIAKPDAQPTMPTQQTSASGAADKAPVVVAHGHSEQQPVLHGGTGQIEANGQHATVTLPRSQAKH